MKYVLLSIIQALSVSGVGSSQEHVVLESETACKQMQQVMIKNPTSVTDTTVVKVTKIPFNGRDVEVTHTVICSPQGS